jgi:hypothetical protein
VALLSQFLSALEQPWDIKQHKQMPFLLVAFFELLEELQLP